jgi:hypothetical protein
MTPTATWTTPWGVSPERAGELAVWLDKCEDESLHPAEVYDRLLRLGWHPTTAAAATAHYRRRFNEHALGYSGLLFATGFAALGAGTAAHLLAAGISGSVNRDALGVWVTVLVCALPFALWSHSWARRADREDPAAVWSEPRRTLALTLLWACGIVGIGRLLIYVAQLVGVIVGASWASGVSLSEGFVNVAITVSIALPLGRWAYGFLHRFDREDPTVPAPHHRPTR